MQKTTVIVARPLQETRLFLTSKGDHFRQVHLSACVSYLGCHPRIVLSLFSLSRLVCLLRLSLESSAGIIVIVYACVEEIFTLSGPRIYNLNCLFIHMDQYKL